MMKKLLTILFMVMTVQMLAQDCEPDPTFADSTVGVYPLPYFQSTMSGGITLPAQIGCPYEFVFQAVVPPTVDFGGNQVTLDWVKLTEENAIGNLPAGVGYACNPPNCEFLSNTIGCVVLFGTPTDPADVGTLDLKIAASISLLGGQIPLMDTFPSAILASDPLDVGNYFLEVLPEPADQSNCVVNTNDKHITPFEFTLAPNPTYGTTTLTVNSEIKNELTLQILNLTGSLIQSQVFQVEQGENSFEILAHDIPEGMYLYSLGNEDGVLTEKILISKQ